MRLMRNINLKDMNIHIQQLTLLTTLFLSTISYGQNKHDIGFRVSTLDVQRYQLDYRFHLNSPYSIVVSAFNGSRSHGTSSQGPLYNDSLFSVVQSGFSVRNSGLQLGVQRKTMGMASDVFYVGASLGAAWQQHKSSLFSGVYAISDTTGSNGNFIRHGSEQVSSEMSNFDSKWLSTKVELTFGMDVPLTKRLLLNAEISLSSFYDRSLTDSFSSFTLMPTASGGIRYQFGKQE